MSEQIQARLQAMDAVLGSMLIDDRCVGPVMAALTAEDFTEPARKMIFVSIQHLFEQGKAIDPVTVLAETGQREELYGFISDLLAITPTAANVMHYAALVKKQALLSKLQNIGSKLLEVSDAETAEALISQANNLMAGRAQHTTYTMEQLLANFYERHDPEKQAVYLDWPLEDLTREVYAEKGDMVVIGGYPSDGKTSLALWFAFNMAQTQRVGFFSYETGKDKLFDRLVAMNARIELPAMKHNELSQHDWDTLAVISGKLTGAKLEIIEANGLTVSQIRAKSLARRYDAVFIDYLQKIKPTGARRNADSFEQVSEISSDLQNFGRQTGIPVIALSQLSRPEKTKNGSTPPPSLASLRQSGQIEQDADVVMLIYHEKPKDSNSRRILNIAKNKEGETNIGLYLSFDGKTQTFKKSYIQAAAPSLPAQAPMPKGFRESPNEKIPPEFEQTELLPMAQAAGKG